MNSVLIEKKEAEYVTFDGFLSRYRWRQPYGAPTRLLSRDIGVHLLVSANQIGNSGAALFLRNMFFLSCN